MNTTRLIAAAALCLSAAVPSFAQEATPDGFADFHSSLSRGEVTAELHAAWSDGRIAATERGYIEPAAGWQSRAAVRDQTLAAIHSGERARINARVPALTLALAVADGPRTLAMAR